VGYWSEKGSAQNRPFTLRLSDIIGGDLDHRYVAAGASDDELVERNARRFWDALKRGDRRTVALMINYPINVRMGTTTMNVRSRKALIDRYDTIFTPEFQASILGSAPLDMFAKDEGVMLGAGQVWFGVDGRVNYLIH
jgi:hypothetical protein